MCNLLLLFYLLAVSLALLSDWLASDITLVQYILYTVLSPSLPCSCVKYVPEPEDSVLLNTALKIFRQFHCYPQALRLALMLNNQALVKELFLECPNK